MPVVSVNNAVKEIDAAACFDLDQLLAPDSIYAQEHGFLLQGTTLDEYQEFIRSAIVEVAKVNDCLAGFVVALPEGHSRLNSLLEQKTRFELEQEHLLDLSPLMWIAKIAVQHKFARQGIGSSLYKKLFDKFPNNHIMTATLISPLKNIASERFHEKMGFRKIGLFHGGDRGGIKNCVSAVVLR